VILISIDTLRAEHLGCYGYERAVTPHIDQLARKGVTFDNAATTAPLTLPAHASILTGRGPLAHGVVDNFLSYLSDGEETLAEMLRARGFATAGFVGSFVLDSRWGVAQGFDVYFDGFDANTGDFATPEANERPGNEVLAPALEWIRAQEGKPFFAFIHLFDPHTPYAPPEPYRDRYGTDLVARYDGEVAFVDSLLGELVSELKTQGLYEKTVLVLVGDHGESLGDHQESTHGFFVYDATIRVPLLIKAPGARRGVRARAQVRTIDILPTVLDLLGLTKPEAVDGVSLRPLLRDPNASLGLTAYFESQYARLHFGWAALRGLRSERYKFIQAPRQELYDLEEDPGETRNLAAERPEVVSDFVAEMRRLEAERARAETRDEPPPDPETVARLRALGYVTEWAAPPAAGGEGSADPKDRIHLYNRIAEAREASRLGELERAVELLTSVVEEEPDVILPYSVLGNVLLEQEAFGEAEAVFRSAVERDTSNLEAIYGLALAHKGLGRWGEAASELQQCLNLDPRHVPAAYKLAEVRLIEGRAREAERLIRGTHANDSDTSLRLLLARALLAQGQPPSRREALQILSRVESMRPEDEVVLLDVGNLLREAGDGEAAARVYRRAVFAESRPQRQARGVKGAEAFNAAGHELARRGDHEGSAQAFRKAVERDPSFAPGYSNLGIALAQLDRLEDAERAFRQAIEVGPGRAEAHNNLGYLYLQTGQPDRALPLFRRAIALEPEYAEARANLEAALSRMPR